MTQRSPHPIGFAVAAGALLLAAAILPLDEPPLSLFACPIRAATGLPCLTCGCTHAFHSFVRGDLAASFLASPLGFALALGCAGYVALTVAGIAIPAPKVSPRAARWTAISALAANWAFLVLRGTG